MLIFSLPFSAVSQFLSMTVDIFSKQLKTSFSKKFQNPKSTEETVCEPNVNKIVLQPCKPRNRVRGTVEFRGDVKIMVSKWSVLTFGYTRDMKRDQFQFFSFVITWPQLCGSNVTLGKCIKTALELFIFQLSTMRTVCSK